MVVLASLLPACGGGGGSKSCPGAQDLSGLWEGAVLSDTVARTNPGTVTLAITQSDCQLGGSWLLQFEDSKLNKLLEVSGSPPETSAVRIDLNQCEELLLTTCVTVNPCTFKVDATLVSPTEMSGTYATQDRCSFSESGSFDITLRGQLTPTPTLVPVALPTPEPVATPTPAP